MYKENIENQTPKRDCWERIETVIKRSEMTANAFARHIGLPRGENLYQIKKGNNGVSLGLADRIVAKFSEVSTLWLLTGDGPMLNEKTEAAGLTPWEKALKRLGAAWKAGFLPMGMLYRDEQGKIPEEWKRFRWEWTCHATRYGNCKKYFDK